MRNPTSEKHTSSHAEDMFREFEKTAFYRWVDRVVTGPFRWLVLPITGLVDAFVLVLPTELVVVLYMMRNPHASWWIHTVITSLFAACGYVLIALIVTWWGLDAVAWMGFFTGEDFVHSFDQQFQDNLVLFAALAGFTSLVPMPTTAFAILAGLFSWSLPLLFLGACIGKCARFGVFAYSSKRWGGTLISLYLRHVNVISIALLSLIVLYLVLK